MQSEPVRIAGRGWFSDAPGEAARKAESDESVRGQLRLHNHSLADAPTWEAVVLSDCHSIP